MKYREKYREKYRVLSLLAITSLTMAGCSSPTTISEWSCPSDQPDGCYDVATGDAIALDVLKAGNPRSGQLGPGQTSTITVSRRPDVDTAIVDRTDALSSRSHTSSKPRGRQDSDLVIAALDADTLDPATGTSGIITPDPATSPISVPVSKMDRVRVSEQLAEIWIGSFEDAQGNYHPASTLYIVVRPAMWRR